MAVQYTEKVPPETLTSLRDIEKPFREDSPFLMHEMQSYYKRNSKLTNTERDDGGGRRGGQLAKYLFWHAMGAVVVVGGLVVAASVHHQS